MMIVYIKTKHIYTVSAEEQESIRHTAEELARAFVIIQNMFRLNKIYDAHVANAYCSVRAFISASWKRNASMITPSPNGFVQ